MKKPTLLTGDETIDGAVESIVFYNPDNGYTVFRFQPEGQEALTAVGSFPPLTPGEVLSLRGRWEVSPRFGRQFKVERFTLSLPASAKGIEKFLASGLVRGIGPVLAARIVKTFGAATVDVLEKAPERLLEVEGIGEAKLREIRASWTAHRDIRDLIVFLQEHDVSTTLATKIHRQYGDRSFTVLRTNPYQLSADIWGIGFKTADQIALKLGLDPGSLERIKAFILYQMGKDIEQGHIFSLESEVRERSAADLEAPAERVDLALADLVREGRIAAEPAGPDRALYLPFYRQAQEEVARVLDRLRRVPCELPGFDLDAALDEEENRLGIRLSAEQRRAVKECFRRRVLVITGGPGTGKTTIIRAVVDLFDRWGKEVLLAAPTGRASKRLAETTGREARTLHRLLEFKPQVGDFKRDAGHPLRGEAVIVDEFSMVDLPLMHHLLRAVPDRMRLILVGDKDQLPSVGPGTLLRDIIEAGTIEVVRLQEIFRQERESLIVVNAHRINQGLSPLYPPRTERTADFYFIRQEDEAKAYQTILKLCSWSIPRRLGLSPLSTEIQVISPMYKGLAGVDNLNAGLQARLNPRRDGLPLGCREIRPRDKVMQLRNDYDKEVFNGDIGTVLHVDRTKFRVFVDFDGRTVAYEQDELGDLSLAYAVSVHKAQGSEYQAVVIPLLTRHFILLQRNLLYTALTRAKRLSVIVGSPKALHIAIKNDTPIKRNSLVRERLIELARTP